MIDAVFISDLHLHPDDKAIEERFNNFLTWAKSSQVKKIYILGDFFHAWAGDDSIDDWSRGIANKLNELTKNNSQLFYIHGNRDFLLGKQFARLAGWTTLVEPALIHLGSKPVILAHGDCYCTKDKAHQYFRKLTRNPLFIWFFLHLPLKFRLKLVNKVRTISQETNKPMEQMDVTPEVIIRQMKRLHVDTLIHGHTHKPGLTTYLEGTQQLKRYVLSDWDDTPTFLCYDNTIGIEFNQLQFFEVKNG